MTFDNPFKLGAIQQISLLDGDAIPKWLESLRRANKCRYGMTVFDRLPNDLQPVPPVAPNTTSFMPPGIPERPALSGPVSMESLILAIDDSTQ